MDEVKLGFYQHFKGMKYRVIGLAKHSETLEDMVIYEALYDNPVAKIWVRPAKMFAETIEKDGKTFKRFTYLGENEPK